MKTYAKPMIHATSPFGIGRRVACSRVDTTSDLGADAVGGGPASTFHSKKGIDVIIGES